MQLPDEDDTPFSLPRDAPEVTPIDYPEFDTGADSHEAYDEGLDNIIDFTPYRLDDDPVKSLKKLMKSGVSGNEFYTTEQRIIQRWTEYRGGQPAQTVGDSGDLSGKGLYIQFEDEEPEIDTESISWSKFFQLFKRKKLAFVYRLKNRSGSLSRFYRFENLADVERVFKARRVQ